MSQVRLSGHLRIYPQGTERVEDDRNVDNLLQQCALDRGDIPQRCNDHSRHRKAQPRDNALKRDPVRSARHLDARQQTVQSVDQKHHVRRLDRCGRAPGPHGHADVCRRQRRRIVHAVAHHHHRPVAPLGKNQAYLLIGCQVGVNPVQPQRAGNRIRDDATIACRQYDPLDSGFPQARKKRGGAGSQ